MADPFPGLTDVLPGYTYASAPAPAAPRGMVDPKPTGATGVMGYLQAPIAGLYEGLGQAGGVAQAGAKLVGADGASQAAADFAAQQRATAATYANPDIDNMAWYDPRNLGYQALKGAPKLAGMIGAAAAGAALAPEAALAAPLAAGAAMFPFLVGENVHAAEKYKGELTPGDAARAFAYGVPEAALAAWTGGKGAAVLNGAGESVGRAAVSQAYTQGLASGGQALIAQQMGDPNRPIAERMGEAIQSALAGGVTGAAFGAGLHAISKTPVAKVKPEDLADVVDKTLAGETPPAAEAAPEPIIPQHEGAEQPGLVHEPAVAQPGLTPHDLDELPHFGQSDPFDLDTQTPAAEAAPVAPLTTGHTGDFDAPGLVNEPGPPVEPGLSAHEFDELPNFAQSRDEGASGFGEAPPPAQLLLPAPRLHTDAAGRTTGDIDTLIATPRDAPVAAPVEGAHPLAEASPDQLKTAARAAARTLPRWLDTRNFDAAQASIRAEIGERGPDSPPLRAAVEKIGQAFGVLDEHGQLIAPPEPPAAARNAPTRDVIPEAHQGRFDTLEGLREPAGDRANLIQEIDDAQTLLAAPGRGDIQRVAKITKQLQKALDGAQAEGALAEARGAEPPKPAPAEAAPVEPHVEPEAPPVAQSVIAKLKEKQPAIVEAPAAEASTPAKPPVYARTPEIASGVAASQASLDALRQLPPPDKKQTAAQWSKVLDEQQAKLDAITNGNAADLANIGARDGYFASHDDPAKESAFDRFYDKLPADHRAALDQHSAVTDGLADALQTHAPTQLGDVFSRPASLAGATAPRTALDVGVTGVVNAGGSGKDVLEVLKAHGTPLQRVVATVLSKLGVDPKISFAPDPVGDRAGTYHAADDRIELHQGVDLAQTALHELVHSASVAALNAGGKAAKAFTELFEDVKARFPDLDPKDNNWLKDPHEFLAEAQSNPDLQDWMRSQPATGGGTLWQKFKGAVAKALGLDGGRQSLLDQVMDAGNRVFDENAGAPRAEGQFAAPATPQGQVERVKQTVGVLDTIGAKLKEVWSDVKSGGYETTLGMRSPREISPGIAKYAPSAVRLTDATHSESNRTNAWNKTRGIAGNAYEALEGADVARHDLAAQATEYGIDPRKPWEQQNPELAKAANADDLKRVATDAYRAYNGLTPAGRAAFDGRIDVDQTARLAAVTQAIHDLAKGQYPELTRGFENDPAKDYQLAGEAHDSPALAKSFWRGQLDQRAASLREAADAALMTLGVSRDQLGALREAAAAKATKGAPEEQAAAARAALAALDKPTLAKLDAYDGWLGDADKAVKALDDVPYFRAGRSGDYYAAGALATDEAGLVSQAAVDRVKGALEAAGFGGRVIERANANSNLYIKVDSAAQADRLRDLFDTLQKEGVLSADKEISSGPAEQAVQHGVGPAVARDMMAMMRRNRPELPEGMDASAAQEVHDAWQHSISAMGRDLMDLLADSSPMKINANRKGVQGFDAQMGKSARNNDAAVSAMLGRLGTARDKGEAIAGMRADLEALKKTNLPTAVKDNVQAAMTELMLREARKPTTPPNSAINALTWVSRASEIGFNPAYFVTLHSQDWTYSVPELGKSHGMLNAAREIARAELPSMKVMRAMLKDPDWAFAGMRLKNLVDGGIKPADAEFLVKLDNMGGMTHGALTQSMFHQEGDSAYGKAANWSTAMGRYFEVQPRIKMALAAKALWRGEAKDGPLLDFALKKINGAQFDYSTENSPRQLTRAGFAGQLSPLVNQFMSFRVKATEKLYREFHDVFAGDTKEQRLEAGKFLAAHLAATTVISGAMGLPMVAVFASVYDKLADALTGSPTHDIMGSFRQYLSHAYGPKVGAAIARGAPTLAGIDLNHLGDQKLMPGSDAIMMLTEKRKFEDAEKDFLKNMAGSAVGLAASWVTGARDIANGDYLAGAIKIAPEALRGPTEAVRDMLHGYRTKGGTPMGITPTGVDLALTAMGLKPETLSNYELDKSMLTGLQTRRTIQSQNITQHLARAVQTQNPDDFRYWAGQSNGYMRDWPGQRPPLADLGRYLQTQMREAAFARGAGAPLGLRPTDLTSRGMLAP